MRTRTANRVGVNADQLPVNKPRWSRAHLQRRCAMRLAGHPNPDAYYEPNSFNGPVQDERFREPPLKLSGDATATIIATATTTIVSRATCSG